MRKRVVWVVTHFEYFQARQSYWLDEAVMFLGSSEKEALRYVRTVHVDPGTWWQLQPYSVDDFEPEQGPPLLYSRGGHRLKNGYPLKRALQLSQRIRARRRKLDFKGKRMRKRGRDGG